MRERLVLEVTDRELHNGMSAVLGLDEPDRIDAVGDKRSRCCPLPSLTVDSFVTAAGKSPALLL